AARCPRAAPTVRPPGPATAGHFPSIEVLDSISRVEGQITTADQRALSVELRRLMAAYRDTSDLIEIGAYVTGANPLVDRAVQRKSDIDTFLRQDRGHTADLAESWPGLRHASGAAEAGANA